jgi:hypothetical protein
VKRQDVCPTYADRVAIVGLWLGFVFAGHSAAWAQGASVEELKRRLQRAKDEMVRRDAAAAKARDEAEVETGVALQRELAATGEHDLQQLQLGWTCFAAVGLVSLPLQECKRG